MCVYISAVLLLVCPRSTCTSLKAPVSSVSVPQAWRRRCAYTRSATPARFAACFRVPLISLKRVLVKGLSQRKPLFVVSQRTFARRCTSPAARSASQVGVEIYGEFVEARHESVQPCVPFVIFRSTGSSSTCIFWKANRAISQKKWVASERAVNIIRAECGRPRRREG